MSPLETRIGYQFRNPDFLKEALTHRSFVAENASAVPDNQRLEFLGDAVIQIVITQRIYTAYPDLPEGKLTKIRAGLTRQETLVNLARAIELGPELRLGRGEAQNDGADRPSNLCDAFEALIGAIFLDNDCGLPPCARIVDELVDRVCPDVDGLIKRQNPKGALQEWAQGSLRVKPRYELLDQSGPDHEREFLVAVYIGDELYGKGIAGKRQVAETNAARDALQRIQLPPSD